MIGNTGRRDRLRRPEEKKWRKKRERKKEEDPNNNSETCTANASHHRPSPNHPCVQSCHPSTRYPSMSLQTVQCNSRGNMHPSWGVTFQRPERSLRRHHTSFSRLHLFFKTTPLFQDYTSFSRPHLLFKTTPLFRDYISFSRPYLFFETTPLFTDHTSFSRQQLFFKTTPRFKTTPLFQDHTSCSLFLPTAHRLWLIWERAI